MVEPQTVSEVRPLPEQTLWLRFSDGLSGWVDVGAIHQFRGSFERLRDPVFFGRVRVDPRWGTVRWPGGLDLDPALLRERLRETRDTQRPA